MAFPTPERNHDPRVGVFGATFAFPSATLVPDSSDGDVEKFYTEVFVALQTMIGKASRRNPVSIASASVCYGFVTDGKDKEILEMSELFETCVEIGYGRRISARARMEEDYERLARLVMSGFL